MRVRPEFWNINVSLNLSEVSVCSYDFFDPCLTLFLSLTLSGKNCELCISGFFRLEESDPASLDVCQPCNCHAAGTVNGSMECAQVHTLTQTTSCRWSVKLLYRAGQYIEYMRYIEIFSTCHVVKGYIANIEYNLTSKCFKLSACNWLWSLASLALL